jgi:uncharacterized protein YgbK (DUF1537 family)
VQKRLDFGVAVSTLLMDIVKGLPSDISFLISKGGITSNDVLSTGLSLRSARLLGQILPVSPWSAQQPIITSFLIYLWFFSGNVGDVQALATVYQRLCQ